MARKEKLPPNVSVFTDRHGKRRYRWRIAGRSAYFTAHPNSPEGKVQLAAFIASQQTVQSDRYAYGSVGWAATRYYASTAFLGAKSPSTARTARLILEKFVADVEHDLIANFRFDHIEALLLRAAEKRKNEKGRMVGGPSAANNLRGELKPFFDYAIKLLGLLRPNPVDQADTISVPKGGFHTWTEDEIQQYRTHHALGTKARLALEIFLWTALRRGDASTFGRSHLKDGRIEVTPSKTKDSTGQTLWLPAAPQLIEAIEAMPVTGTDTFLVTDYGLPFTRAGLGQRMRKWCDDAGLPHCSAHGLRKAAARRAAENGATNQELKAVGGWTTDRQVSVYTAAVEQKRMAEQAMGPVIDFDLSNRSNR
jgi:hypothetical protein